ncbi:MAG: hypothetical protein HYZ75_04845 [Elusimicrobia bacterium]|nr:hypothetical protein [Elusimicrobiota bacterium]
MALADTIEQLSFGRSMPHMESCLGIHLSPEAIFLSEVKAEKGRPQVMHLLKLPMPGSSAGKQTKTAATLSSDFLADIDKVAAVISKALSEGSWKSKHAMVSLSSEFGILRFFTMPWMDRRFWKSAVPVEAKKYIPIPFQTLASDFQVFALPPGADKKPRLGALYGVTQRKSLESLRKLVEKLGLILVGTELAPVSVERLWDTLSPETAATSYAQVHFDGGQTRILVSDKGVPVFYREVLLADDATVMDRRKVDLVGCVDFTRKQLGLGEPKNARVSGQVGDIKSWQDAFAQDLGQPVAYQDTDKLLGLRGGQWGGYASIGAALRHLVGGSLSLDLSAIGKISDEDRRAATTILTIGAALTGIMVLVGGTRTAMLHSSEAKLKLLTTEGGVYTVFRGKKAEDIANIITSMRDKINSFGALTAQQTPLTRIFEIIAERIPESAWVNDIKYENPLSLDGRRSLRVLTLSGAVSDKSRAIEQEVAYRLGDNLRSDPRFLEAFPVIEPSVEAPSEKDSGEDSKKVTTYVIKCTSRKERTGA